MAYDARQWEMGERDDAEDDRRRFERFVASVPVGFRRDGASHPHMTRTWDIAERGACVRAKEAVEPGTSLVLELEVVMPTKVRLGFDVDALVIDGPAQSHFARVTGVVRRCEQCADGSYDIGIEFSDDTELEHLHVVGMYLDHLRDGFRSQYG